MNRVYGRPTTAFVLAAGLGTRLRPLTKRTPKPLLEVRGKPILFHVFAQLAAAGVTRFVVNIHHLPKAFYNALPENQWNGFPVEWVHEPVRLETGGGLRNVLHLLPAGEPVFLAAGDILSTAPLQSLANAHLAAGRPLATLQLRSSGPPQNVEVFADGTVADLRDLLGRPGRSRLGYAAVAIIEPSLYRPYFKPTGPESIVDVWVKALRNGLPIQGHVDDSGIWTDIGTPEALDAARRGLDNPTGADQPGPEDNPADTSSIHVTALDLSPDAQVTIQPVPGGASDRSFYRVHVPGGSVIACRFTTRTRPEYATYGKLAAMLHAAGLPVPQVRADDPDSGWVWLEDCGDRRLDQVLPDLSADAVDRIYHEVRVAIIQLQSLPAATVSDLPTAGVFDDECYFKEHEYFLRELVAPILGQTVAQLRNRLGESLLFLRSYLETTRERFVPVHRDLQASNILLTPDGFRWIDFQSMRTGHPAFDTASLLLDPQANHPQEWIDAQIDADATLRQIDPDTWREQIRIVGTQRLLQALGAYGLHGIRNQRPEFRERIPIALRTLARNLPDFINDSPFEEMVLNLLAKID